MKLKTQARIFAGKPRAAPPFGNWCTRREADYFMDTSRDPISGIADRNRADAAACLFPREHACRSPPSTRPSVSLRPDRVCCFSISNRANKLCRPAVRRYLAQRRRRGMMDGFSGYTVSPRAPWKGKVRSFFYFPAENAPVTLVFLFRDSGSARGRQRGVFLGLRCLNSAHRWFGMVQC